MQVRIHTYIGIYIYVFGHEKSMDWGSGEIQRKHETRGAETDPNPSHRSNPSSYSRTNPVADSAAYEIKDFASQCEIRSRETNSGYAKKFQAKPTSHAKRLNPVRSETPPPCAKLPSCEMMVEVAGWGDRIGKRRWYGRNVMAVVWSWKRKERRRKGLWRVGVGKGYIF